MVVSFTGTLDQSLQRLNRSLADLEKVTATARENAGPIVKSVRNAASSLESTPDNRFQRSF